MAKMSDQRIHIFIHVYFTWLHYREASGTRLIQYILNIFARWLPSPPLRAPFPTPICWVKSYSLRFKDELSVFGNRTHTSIFWLCNRLWRLKGKRNLSHVGWVNFFLVQCCLMKIVHVYRYENKNNACYSFMYFIE